ncbi:MAG: ArnT family glycosyltransferase [Oscillospiraceae bacterium]|jgi:4-amino-4-deoxy-L-arabinose transferase-like glycosyltransferase
MEDGGNKRRLILALLLIAAGTALRSAALGVIPAGLNQDEASSAYEAFALMTEGIDRAGNARPVLLTAWGSGQNILYTLLTIPVFRLFGISMVTIRLVSLVLGCASMPVFYLLMKRLFGPKAALWGLLVLALNPWHIMLSRWALESNLLPFFLLCGTYFLSLSIPGGQFSLPKTGKPAEGLAPKMPLDWHTVYPFLFAGASYALALYAYGTAFLFLPFFLPAATAYFIRRGRKLISILPGAVLFLVLAVPILLTNIINMFGLPQMELLGLTLPRLTEARQAETTVLGGGGIPAALGNLRDFIKLLIFQTDGLRFNALPGFGTMYFFGLAFSAWGAVWAAKNKRAGLVFIWLFCCLPAAALTEVNINRMNMVYMPLLIFAGIGAWRCAFILKKLLKGPAAALLPAALYVAAGAFFAFFYFHNFNAIIGKTFFEGFSEAVRYAETLGKDRVYITDSVNMPYIYVLLENRIAPSEFIETVEYINPDGAFRWVRRFGKYEFGRSFDHQAPGTVYIVESGEDAGFEAWHGIEFGYYRVLWR